MSLYSRGKFEICAALSGNVQTQMSVTGHDSSRCSCAVESPVSLHFLGHTAKHAGKRFWLLAVQKSWAVITQDLKNDNSVSPAKYKEMWGGSELLHSAVDEG